LARGRKPPSQTWRTFLENHVGDITAVDFFFVATVSPKAIGRSAASFTLPVTIGL
jgi:hypothetical protein